MIPEDRSLAGVDGGGSRTRAAIFHGGECRGRSEAGPSNPRSAGVEASCAAILEALGIASENAGLELEKLAAVGLGIAGIGRAYDASSERGRASGTSSAREQLVSLLRSWIGDVPIGLWTDQEAALAGAFGGGPGILVIGGTGSSAIGFDGMGYTVRAGGWGRRLRDPGSGFDILREAVLMVLSIADGLRSGGTELTHLLPEALGIPVKDSLEERAAGLASVFDEGPTPEQLLAAFRAIWGAAEQGDYEALCLLEEAGSQLAQLARTVASRLPGERSYTVVGIGGLLEKANPVREAFERSFTGDDVEQRRLVLSGPAASPEHGAAALAAELFLRTDGPLAALLAALQSSAH